MRNDLENTLPDINKGRINALRWCYAAVMLLLCCLSENLMIFLCIAHALILAWVFLKTDMSVFVSEQREFVSFDRVTKLNAHYQAELDAKKPCWFASFAVYNFAKVDEAEPGETPKLSSRMEQIWLDGFNDDTIELDASVPAEVRKRSAAVQFDFD